MSAYEDIEWYNVLMRTEGKTCDRVVFDEYIDTEHAESEENDKLRELVRDMYMAMWTCNQYACKHGKDGCYTEDGDNGGKCALRDRMHELGVRS